MEGKMRKRCVEESYFLEIGKETYIVKKCYGDFGISGIVIEDSMTHERVSDELWDKLIGIITDIMGMDWLPVK